MGEPPTVDEGRRLPSVRSECFDLSAEGDVTVVTMRGPGAASLTDAEAADALRVDFALLASQAPAKVKLLLDFAAVVLVASPVLAGLIELQRNVAAGQGHVKLVVTHETLHETFVVTKLDRHFELHDSRQAALASFKSSPRLQRA